MSNISLPFGLIRKEKKSLIYQKTMKQVNTLKNYISKEDPTFQNLIIDVINNKSDLKYLLALSDYGRNYINLLWVIMEGNYIILILLLQMENLTKP